MVEDRSGEYVCLAHTCMLVFSSKLASSIGAEEAAKVGPICAFAQSQGPEKVCSWQLRDPAAWDMNELTRSLRLLLRERVTTHDALDGDLTPYAQALLCI